VTARSCRFESCPGQISPVEFNGTKFPRLRGRCFRSLDRCRCACLAFLIAPCYSQWRRSPPPLQSRHGTQDPSALSHNSRQIHESIRFSTYFAVLFPVVSFEHIAAGLFLFFPRIIPHFSLLIDFPLMHFGLYWALAVAPGRGLWSRLVRHSQAEENHGHPDRVRRLSAILQG
jgi:hypothetical protein